MHRDIHSGQKLHQRANAGTVCANPSSICGKTAPFLENESCVIAVGKWTLIENTDNRSFLMACIQEDLETHPGGKYVSSTRLSQAPL